MNQYNLIRFYITHLYNWMQNDVKLEKADIISMQKHVNLKDLIVSIKVFIKDKIIQKQLLNYVQSVA